MAQGCPHMWVTTNALVSDEIRSATAWGSMPPVSGSQSQSTTLAPRCRRGVTVA